MLIGDYEHTLVKHIENEDLEEANKLLMTKLADALTDNKQEFVDLLNECDIEADMSMPKSQLIDLFIKNTDNKKLLIGSSMLLQMSKTNSSFEGVDDDSVKNGVAVMNTYFNNVEPDEEYSYIAPFLVGALTRGARNLINKRTTPEQRGRVNDAYRQLAERQMREQAILRQRVELEQRQRLLEQRKATQRVNAILIISGLALTGTIAFFMLRRK